MIAVGPFQCFGADLSARAGELHAVNDLLAIKRVSPIIALDDEKLKFVDLFLSRESAPASLALTPST